MNIDVSKCKYYTKNDRECIAEGEDIPLDCNCIDDCYYKQLQQTKEHCNFIDETNKILYQEKVDLIKENEQLKQELQLSQDNIAELNELLIAEKEENGELKEEIRQLHNKREPQELYTLFGKPIRYWEMLEQKLEKIKQICKKCKNQDDAYVMMYAYKPYVSAILQIIESETYD